MSRILYRLMAALALIVLLSIDRVTCVSPSHIPLRKSSASVRKYPYPALLSFMKELKLLKKEKSLLPNCFI